MNWYGSYVLALAIMFGFVGCAPMSRPQFVEIELTGIPENQVAVQMGPLKTLVQDRGQGRADLDFSLGQQHFTGMMQAIDDAVTTNSAGATSTKAAAVGAVGSTNTAMAARSQQQSSSTSTTSQAMISGVANAVSDKGTTMKCDYTVNRKAYTGTGICELSNGAKYRVYSKPVRIVMTDGTSRPM